MGWDIDRFPEGEVNLELICCICTCILEDPVESPCRHVFCSKCIRQWLLNEKTCPHCRATVYRRDLQSVVPLLKNIISKQRIYCDYKEMGCTETVSLENLESHTALCDFGTVTCSNNGCHVKVIRKDLKQHTDTCMQRMLVCDQGCEMPLTLRERETHNCIRYLFVYFQNIHTDLLDRISKLEEQVNVLTSKNNRRYARSSYVSNRTYTCAPYTIPSPRHYEVRPPYAVYGENMMDLTRGYEDENNEGSDAAESGSSDNVNRHSSIPTRGLSPTSLREISPPYELRSPDISEYNDDRTSPVRPTTRNSRRSQTRDGLEERNSEEPIVLRIGVSSQTVSGSSSSSSSSTDTETD